MRKSISEVLVALSPVLSLGAPPSSTLVHDAVVKAKKASHTRVTIPPGITETAAFQDLDSASENALILRATLVEKDSVLFTTPVEEISTYLHFTINQVFDVAFPALPSCR